MRRTRPAATACNIQKSFIGKGSHDPRHFFRRLFVVPGFIGQTRIGVCGNKTGCFCCKFRQIGTHFRGSQRTVEPDGKPVGGMGYGNKERFCILSAEQSAGGIGNGSGDHHRDRQHIIAPFPFQFADGINGGFYIQCIKTGFDEQYIRTAIDQTCRRFFVGFCQFIKGQIPVCRIGNGRGKRERFSCRPHGSGNKSRFCRILFRKGVCGTAGNGGTGAVEFIYFIAQSIFLLGKTVGIEGVGFDDIGTGTEIFGVDA